LTSQCCPDSKVPTTFTFTIYPRALHLCAYTCFMLPAPAMRRMNPQGCIHVKYMFWCESLGVVVGHLLYSSIATSSKKSGPQPQLDKLSTGHPIHPRRRTQSAAEKSPRRKEQADAAPTRNTGGDSLPPKNLPIQIQRAISSILTSLFYNHWFRARTR
jgi:hypothetical protein